jgi:TolA-binding protein
MSERSKLEQVLEFLLAEDNERAEELLHEYVVETARFEYERILDEDEVVESKDEDEDEDEAVEEAVESEEEEAVEEDFAEVSEIIDEADPEDDMVADVEADDEDEEDHHADVGGDDALEDKVDELEDELEDLRAEFEKLMGDESDDGEEAEMDMDMDMDMDAPEMEEESIEYDLDEEVVEEEDDEVVEEATKLSDNVAEPKGGVADSNESPYTKTPKKTTVSGAGTPVKANDGSMGDQSASAKDHTPTDNIKVEPKKA